MPGPLIGVVGGTARAADGSGGRDRSVPGQLIGVVGGTAQNQGAAIRAGRLAEGAVRRIVSVSPRAVTPAMCLARPAL